MSTTLSRFSSFAHFIITTNPLPKVWLCIIASLLTSCIFEPSDDDNYVFVNPEYEIAPVKINLLDVGDTIDVGGPVEFQYDISGYAMSKPYRMFFQAGEFYQYLNSFEGTFSYYPEVSEGYIKATLTVSTNSGTNSLADRNDRERIVYEQSWILNVHTRTPEKGPRITSIEPFNGSLRISWEKYDKPNFAFYLVYKNGELLATIEDANVTSLIDPDFIGEAASYGIVMRVKNGDYAYNDPATYSGEVPKILKYEITADGQLKVYWSASRYPNNFQRYEIYQNDYMPYNSEPLFSTTNLTDTTFTFIPRFGDPERLRVFTYSKNADDFNGYVVSEKKEYYFSEKTNTYELICFAPKMNRYFIKQEENLTAFTIDDNQLVANATIDRYITNLIVSHDENSILALHNNQVYRWESSTLQSQDQIDLSSIKGPNEKFVAVGSLANNTFLLGKASTISPNSSVIFYNAQTQTIEKEYIGIAGQGVSLQISTDNNFVLSKGNGHSRILKLEADNTLMQTITWGGNSSMFFNPDDDGKVIIGSELVRPDGAAFIRDLETGSLVENIPTPSMTVVTFDAESGIIFGPLQDGSGDFIAFDYKNQKILIRTKGITTHDLILNGNYLYSPNGVRLRLK
jgi:hypothetical protein